MSCLAAVHSGWNSQQQQKTWGTASPVLSHPSCSFFLVLSNKSPLTFPPIFFFNLVIVLIWQSCQRKFGHSNTLTTRLRVKKNVILCLASCRSCWCLRHILFFFSWVTHKCQEIYPSLSTDPFCCVLLWLYIHPWVHTSNWIYFDIKKMHICSELSLLRISQLAKGCSNI